MARPHFYRDRVIRYLCYIGASAIAAYLLARSGLIQAFFLVSQGSELIGIFVAGVLFTSIFTTTFALALFIAMAPFVNIPTMALVGALGAVLGDLAIFGLVRFTIQKDIEYLVNLPKYRRFAALFHRRMFRWMLPFVGAVIIASPLPDELGIGLMGVSRMRPSTLIAVSFVMNAIGIALIAWAA